MPHIARRPRRKRPGPVSSARCTAWAAKAIVWGMVLTGSVVGIEPTEGGDDVSGPGCAEHAAAASIAANRTAGTRM